jgi:hypothetical protein
MILFILLNGPLEPIHLFKKHNSCQLFGGVGLDRSLGWVFIHTNYPPSYLAN